MKQKKVMKLENFKNEALSMQQTFTMQGGMKSGGFKTTFGIHTVWGTCGFDEYVSGGYSYVAADQAEDACG